MHWVDQLRWRLLGELYLGKPLNCPTSVLTARAIEVAGRLGRMTEGLRALHG